MMEMTTRSSRSVKPRRLQLMVIPLEADSTSAGKLLPEKGGSGEPSSRSSFLARRPCWARASPRLTVAATTPNASAMSR
jgi:hypothetical protein